MKKFKKKDREVEGSVGLVRKLNKLRGQREKGKTEMKMVSLDAMFTFSLRCRVSWLREEKSFVYKKLESPKSKRRSNSEGFQIRN